MQLFLLQYHLHVLFHQVMQPHDMLIHEATSQAKVIVSTADAWAKQRAGDTSGLTQRVVRKLNMCALFIDEMQVGEVLQQVAVGGEHPHPHVRGHSPGI